MTYDEFAKFVSTYDLDYTGQAHRRAEEPAAGAGRAVRRPEGQGDVVLDHGLQPAHRGVWCNNMVYNIHLLTGKISTPGNSPFSLTGQPSACGTAREVGTFAHRLPADMVVTNPKHREHAEEIWKLPHGTIPTCPATTRCCRTGCSRTASSTPTG
jgi:nitrate reductase NapA